MFDYIENKLIIVFIAYQNDFPIFLIHSIKNHKMLFFDNSIAYCDFFSYCNPDIWKHLNVMEEVKVEVQKSNVFSYL